MSIFQVLILVRFTPFLISPKGEKRVKIAWQAILAKAPVYRVGHRSCWPLPKISQGADFLTVGPPRGGRPDNYREVRGYKTIELLT
jgi:hypothetical protein